MSPSAQTQARLQQSLAALSAPIPASGYVTVGVTWQAPKSLSDDEITLSVRTSKNDKWSSWELIPYDSEHGSYGENDPIERPGTDPIAVGQVDQVQLKVTTTSGVAPTDMKLAIVDPGSAVARRREGPAIDTARLTDVDATGALSKRASFGTSARRPTPAVRRGTQLEAASATVTAKPLIYSRAQWGADESMRDKSSLRYGQVRAGFVHHTVNANDYTREQVPAIIRGIYAYHTQSKGWSDIGYNFLVDRFGRIWEGRYGGVNRPVVGAHTLGYNENSFAMSAIGNYQTAKPSDALVEAYGRLFAWKLSLHGVNAASTKQWVKSKYFPAINGHSDAGQTACPGMYLYMKLNTIRRLAAQYQQPFAPRSRRTNISGSTWPDLIGRDKATNEVSILQTGGQTRFRRDRGSLPNITGGKLLTAVGDVTGDKQPDLLVQKPSSQQTGLIAGNGSGFNAWKPIGTNLSALDQVAGPGDLNGDGLNDLIGRTRATKRLYLYRGAGNGTFAPPRLVSSDWSRYSVTTAAGDFNRDGKQDLFARDIDGYLWFLPGHGKATFTTRIRLPGNWIGFDNIRGGFDVTNDGKPDLLARSKKTKATYIYPGNGRGGFTTRYGPFTELNSTNNLAMAGRVDNKPGTDIIGTTSTGKLALFSNSGGRNLTRIIDTGLKFTDTNLILNVGDWNGDGLGDAITRTASTGTLLLRIGTTSGKFAKPTLAATNFAHVKVLAAVGDVTGDGFPDLQGQPTSGVLRIYPGDGKAGFSASYASGPRLNVDRQVGMGLWNSDGAPDSLFRRTDGSWTLFAGNGPGGLTQGTKMTGNLQPYDWMQGVGDGDGNGRPDLLARERSTGRLWLLPADGNAIGQRRLVADGLSRYDLLG